MRRWSIKGRWFGEYAFDQMPEYPQGFAPVPFIMDIEEEWGGKFRGRVKDDMPDPAMVQGETAGVTVEFTKQMPVFYVGPPDHIRLFEEWVKREFNLEVDYSVRSPPIHYEGTFSSDGEEIEGKWAILEHRIHFRTAGNHRFVDLLSTSGTWHARRQPNA